MTIIRKSEAGIFIMMVVLAAVFQVINPVFLSLQNVAGMLRAMAIPGIVAVGLGLCLIAGTMDISVGAIAGLSGIVFSKLVVHGYPIYAAVIIAIGIGIMAGAINSIVIVRFKVSPFIATISAMYIYRGIGNFISSGFTVYPLPANIPAFGSAQPLGLSWPFIILVVIMVVVTIAMASTWGLCVRAVGSDSEVAFCNEVNVKAIQHSVIIISGGLAGIAGILVTCVLGAGQPYAGTGWELTAIAACAIGGVSLFGYQGNMIGLFMGLFTLQIINNGIVTAGVSVYLQVVTIGIILLVSMVMEAKRRSYLNLERI